MGNTQQKPTYEIRASWDGVRFKHMAQFTEGEPSRSGTPFNLEAALLEVRGFKETRGVPFVQLIITL